MESPGIVSLAAKTLSKRSENSLRPEVSLGIYLGPFLKLVNGSCIHNIAISIPLHTSGPGCSKAD